MAPTLSNLLRSCSALGLALVMNSASLKAETATAASVPGTAPTAIVEMRSISFAPKKVVLTAGQSVEWKNVSLTDHSATSNDEGKTFDTGMVEPKASKSIVFAKAGQYSYHCTMHGRTMSGLVVVNPKP